MIMNAKKFLDEFLKKIKKKSVYEGRKLFDIYKSDSAYTPVITNIINEIIKEADYFANLYACPVELRLPSFLFQGLHS